MRKFIRIGGRSICCWLVLFLSCSYLFANPTKEMQERSVTGTVKAQIDGKGIPGVSVLVKGSGAGAITDADGKYSISIPEGSNVVLVFTSIGFVSQERPVDNQSVIDVQLTEDTQALDEIVVVGYGIQKKANLTGAISTVKFDDLSSIPAPNTASLLQGRMSGVTVSSGGAQPGKDDPIIHIRGIGTLGNTRPMIVIDGIEASSFNQVSPNDIEDITVLKDAASAAIYGVRAANGVILIRTKSGTEGKPTVNVHSTMSFSKPTVLPDYVESWDWAALQNEVKGQEIYTAEMIAAMRNGTDPDNFANTRWAEEVFTTGITNKQYLSVSGGAPNTKYRVSLEHLKQDGMMKGTSSRRVNFRSNIESRLNDRLVIGLNTSGLSQSIEEPTNGAATIMWRLDHFARPTVPVRYANGHYGKWDGAPLQPVNILNPIQEIEEHPKQENRYNANVQVYASVDFFKNFNFKTQASARFNHALISRYTPKRQDHDAQGVLRFTEPFNSLTEISQTGNVYQFDNYITYNKAFEAHAFSAMAGHSQQATRIDESDAYIEDFPNDQLYELDAGASNPSVGGNAIIHRIQSIFGRLNYSYQEKYLVEMNVRRDGSSRIPAENRYGIFPSFSVGWRVSEEGFLRDAAFLPEFKIRGSWGKLGNQEIGNYPYSQVLSLRQNYLFGGSLVAGAALTELANPDIKWETTTMTDIGVDLALLDGKLSMTADYFIKNTSDILLRLPINLTLGRLAAPYQNAGEVENRGWEWDVLYRNASGDFSYSIGANLTKVTNKILDLKGLEVIQGNTILRESNPIGSYFGYVADGIYQSEEEIANGPVRFNGIVKPGDMIYRDISGPAGNADGKVDAMDRTIIGSPFPELTYSFTGNVSYKNFRVSVFFQGISGLDRFSFQSTQGNITKRYLARWQADQPSTEFPRLNGISNEIGSTFWLEDASYLRLKNLELAYDFPREWIHEKLGINNLRLYLMGTNLLTFTKIDDWDPEKFASDMSNQAYPQDKTYVVGINLNF